MTLQEIFICIPVLLCERGAKENIYDLLQMAVWQSASGKVYLPPSTPVARVQSTDEYVERTNIYYHANSDRLLTVGHDYFKVWNNEGT